MGIVSSLLSYGGVVWSRIWLFGRGCCPTRSYRYAKTRVGLFHKHPILLTVMQVVSDKSIQLTRYYLVRSTAKPNLNIAYRYAKTRGALSQPYLSR